MIRKKLFVSIITMIALAFIFVGASLHFHAFPIARNWDVLIEDVQVRPNGGSIIKMTLIAPDSSDIRPYLSGLCGKKDETVIAHVDEFTAKQHANTVGYHQQVLIDSTPEKGCYHFYNGEPRGGTPITINH